MQPTRQFHVAHEACAMDVGASDPCHVWSRSRPACGGDASRAQNVCASGAHKQSKWATVKHFGEAIWCLGHQRSERATNNLSKRATFAQKRRRHIAVTNLNKCDVWKATVGQRNDLGEGGCETPRRTLGGLPPTPPPSAFHKVARVASSGLLLEGAQMTKFAHDVGAKCSDFTLAQIRHNNPFRVGLGYVCQHVLQHHMIQRRNQLARVKVF